MTLAPPPSTSGVLALQVWTTTQSLESAVDETQAFWMLGKHTRQPNELYVYGGERLSCSPTFYPPPLRQGHFLVWNLLIPLDWLVASATDPSVHASLTLGYKHAPLHLAFFVGSGDRTKVFRFTGQALFQLNHCLSLIVVLLLYSVLFDIWLPFSHFNQSLFVVQQIYLSDAMSVVCLASGIHLFPISPSLSSRRL